jgi:hypothetical protein
VDGLIAGLMLAAVATWVRYSRDSNEMPVQAVYDVYDADEFAPVSTVPLILTASVLLSD